MTLNKSCGAQEDRKCSYFTGISKGKAFSALENVTQRTMFVPKLLLVRLF